MKRTDNRDRTAYARFKKAVAGILLCCCQQLGTLIGNQLLIGGNNADSALQTGHQVCKCWFRPAQAFGNDGDIAVLQNRVNRFDEFVSIRRVRKIAEVKNISQLQLIAGFFIDLKSSTTPEPTVP